MTSDPTGTGRSRDEESSEPTGPVIRDKRRIDPQTGQVRTPGQQAGTSEKEATMSDDQQDATPTPGSDSAFGGAVGDDLPGRQPGAMPDSPFNEAENASFEADLAANEARANADHPDTVLAAERLADLQRLQAEYVNYKKRVDRDKLAMRDHGVGSVIEALMPVLDEIHLARQHGDLEAGSPFASIADKLEQALGRLGLERYGAEGDEFDPAHHEALMHVEAQLPPEATTTTVVTVLQPGYKHNERVLRPARVSVADPQ